MLFKDYLAGLNQLLKENPQLANAVTVYSHDDEGNQFQEVYSNGTIGVRIEDQHGCGDFVDHTLPVKHDDVIAVCIN